MGMTGIKIENDLNKTPESHYVPFQTIQCYYMYVNLKYEILSMAGYTSSCMTFASKMITTDILAVFLSQLLKK